MGTDILIYLGGLALLDMLIPTNICVNLFQFLTDNKNLTSILFTYRTIIGKYILGSILVRYLL